MTENKGLGEGFNRLIDWVIGGTAAVTLELIRRALLSKRPAWMGNGRVLPLAENLEERLSRLDRSVAVLRERVGASERGHDSLLEKLREMEQFQQMSNEEVRLAMERNGRLIDRNMRALRELSNRQQLGDGAEG